MFQGFANVWTPVCLAAELRREQPLAIKVAGTPVVLFRGEGGAPVALIDRCPHRGVALSLGAVKNGCLECPFHGWRFNGRGAVCHVPWNPDAKTEQLRAVTVAARELAGMIWIYTAPDTRPDREPEVAEPLLRPDIRISGGAVDWNTHWTRAMENMLDWPHLPFVHRGTIGKGMLKRSDARMDIQVEERPYGLHTTITMDGQEHAGALELRWPNMMNLFIAAGRRTLIMQVACVPIDEQRTRMLLLTVRDFLRWRILDPIFHRLNLRIATEDKAIVESSWPVEIPQAAAERSVRTDAPTLLFRKRYFKELRRSGEPRELARLPVLGTPPAANEHRGTPD